VRHRRTDNYGPAPVAPGSTPESAIAIHTLTAAARDVIEGAIPQVWIRGEVTDFKAHRNGHWYFSLRDSQSQIKCVVWSTQRQRIPAPPDDGMQVIAFGQVTVWPVRGDLQFSVLKLDAQGDGLWRKALERVRLRLEADGLLAASRKRPLPPFPRRIAVITSPDGAALHDIVRVSQSRSPDVEIIMIPAAVQGDGAPASLRRAIGQLCRWGGADMLIIGRGGGSREDLWAFNDEGVARALAACPIPTVSAVGHEVDITICDLVADVRAATPSAAAELAVPSRREIADRVRVLGKRLSSAAVRRRDRAVAAVGYIRNRMQRSATRVVERRRARIETLAGRVDALSPLSTLARGYAVARNEDGRTLSNRENFGSGTPFELWVRDGIVDATAHGSRPLPEDVRPKEGAGDDV
jgi:exodeoxyribonuclease VII large subunit